MKIQLTATVMQTIEIEDGLDMVERMRVVTDKMQDIASDLDIDGWESISDFNFSVMADEDPPEDDEEDEDDGEDGEDGEGGDEEVTAV